MISQVDIDDWTEQDYLDVVDDIPQIERVVQLKRGDDDEEVYIDLNKLIIAYGRALHARITMSIKD